MPNTANGTLPQAGVVLLAFLVLCSCRDGSSPIDDAANATDHPTSPSARLRALASDRDDYLILVGIPLTSPTDWAEATRGTGDSLVVEGHGHCSISDVTAFIVTYPSGQLIDYEANGLPFPESVTGLSPSREPVFDILQLSDLEEGGRILHVEYGPSASRPDDPDHYSTSLTNVSEERVRITRFAGYSKTDRGWELTTVTGAFYTSEEFQEWYGLGTDDWIEPGESVADSSNYGSPPVLWAYYGVSESGREFVAGAVLE